jgi:ribosomal protein S18 acetylase RimI-like enzyme
MIENLELLQITEENIDTNHICCAIGKDKVNVTRATTKKQWLKQRFPEGLVFTRFNARGKFFIEYLPIEHAWKPLLGTNLTVINCLWVSGRYKRKGLGKQLLETCIHDAHRQHHDGVCVVSSRKKMSFLTDKSFFVKHGFEPCDTAYPYFELLVYPLTAATQRPAFTEQARNGVFKNSKEFSFIFSNQCPFMEEYAQIMATVCETRGHTAEIIKLHTKNEALKLGSPFGTFGVYHHGQFILHEPMAAKKFNAFLNKQIN